MQRATIIVMSSCCSPGLKRLTSSTIAAIIRRRQLPMFPQRLRQAGVRRIPLQPR